MPSLVGSEMCIRDRWIVYLYECPSCRAIFRYQVDPEGKRKSFIMRVSRREGAR